MSTWLEMATQLGLGGAALGAMVILARWFLNEIRESRADFTKALADEREAFLEELHAIAERARKANDEITAQCALHISATRELRESIERSILARRADEWDSRQPG